MQLTKLFAALMAASSVAAVTPCDDLEKIARFIKDFWMVNALDAAEGQWRDLIQQQMRIYDESNLRALHACRTVYVSSSAVRDVYSEQEKQNCILFGDCR
ncbi:hypothetical protein HJFPF1_10600 [Paramyrothecium foliicola]|nr:hypothetical protein HJFPF1_10600 [Paramyrothecium foliicola]